MVLGSYADYRYLAAWAVIKDQVQNLPAALTTAQRQSKFGFSKVERSKSNGVNLFHPLYSFILCICLFIYLFSIFLYYVW